MAAFGVALRLRDSMSAADLYQIADKIVEILAGQPRSVIGRHQRFGAMLKIAQARFFDKMENALSGLKLQ
ncbi:MAG: hypothetical protein DMG95_04860, partial [Acidobacteria bacterium]